MKYTPLLLLLAFVCISSCSLGERTENTVDVQKEGIEKLITKGTDSVQYDGIKVAIKGNGTTFYLGNQVWNIEVGKDTIFPERHSNLRLSLIKVEGDSAKMRYTSIFDHHSFGKALVTTDSGVIEVKLK